MEPELFILSMAETEECQAIMYKRISIRKLMGIFCCGINNIYEAEPFLLPFGLKIKEEIQNQSVDVDMLMKYMISNDKSHCALFSAQRCFKPKPEMSEFEYLSLICKNQVITPYTEVVDLDALSLITECFIFDNLYTSTFDISKVVEEELFAYPTNQYGLTKINGAIFKKDGLLYDGKGYYYNYFTNKSLISTFDTMPGFATIIQSCSGTFDILYRLDERLSMPESDYKDYTGVAFGKFYGPQFHFNYKELSNPKTIIVHMDNNSQNKLLMVIKQQFDAKINEPFWHIEIETLPYCPDAGKNVITTFLHGMYYPQNDIFTHIDYTKNQYNSTEYFKKYLDSKDGVPIDQHTTTRKQHYKIWCIENGEFSRETWYNLMICSLSKQYQTLLNEILE